LTSRWMQRVENAAVKRDPADAARSSVVRAGGGVWNAERSEAVSREGG